VFEAANQPEKEIEVWREMFQSPTTWTCCGRSGGRAENCGLGKKAQETEDAVKDYGLAAGFLPIVTK